jgi:hypothetical protein
MTSPRNLLATAATVAATVALAPGAAAATLTTRVAGGHATVPADHGRPVALIAGALGVPDEVFREAFSHVTPAVGGTEPDPEQVAENKAALLEALAPYGVTNERLDEVSDHYRYVQSNGETWPQRSAIVRARVRDGKVVGFTIVRPGSGYTTAPRIVVPGYEDLEVRVKIAFAKAFSRNGRVTQVALA